MYNVTGDHILKFNTNVDEELSISGLEATGGLEQWHLELGTDPFMVFGGTAADRAGTNTLTVVGDISVEQATMSSYLYDDASPAIVANELILPIDGKTRTVSWNANITSILTTGSLAYSDTTVVLTMDGTLRTVAWPPAWKWLGTPPEVAINEVLVLKLETINSTVYASAALAESL
jgi:hypothetical protein